MSRTDTRGHSLGLRLTFKVPDVRRRVRRLRIASGVTAERMSRRAAPRMGREQELIVKRVLFPALEGKGIELGSPWWNPECERAARPTCEVLDPRPVSNNLLDQLTAVEVLPS